METTSDYVRRAFLKWEMLRPVYSLLVLGAVIGILLYAGGPWLRFDKDALMAALFVLVVINAVYCLGPLSEGALLLFTNVRMGRARYVLWVFMAVVPVVKLVWLWQVLTFYFMGTIYRG